MEIERIDILQNNFKRTRQYVESFIIVWLDDIFGADNDAAKTIEQLQIISDSVTVFDDSDACIDFITNLKNKGVLFVVSGAVDRCVLILAQDLPVINAVYILSLSDDGNQDKCFQLIGKIKGVYTDTNELMKQIKVDVRRNEHELIGFEILEKSDTSLTTSRNCNKQEYRFMYLQLLKNVFFKFEDNSTPELVKYCRAVYAENSSQLHIIDEFERDYEANKAIWWYTRDSFVYKLINRGLRAQHVETLYHMRTFIRHLHQQLIQLCPIRTRTQSTSILTLYRGQRMSAIEFERLKNSEGGFFSVSQFFSTSASRDTALVYAGLSDDETVAILFELVVDLNHNTNSSFACIEQFSNFGDEQEWLFSMGAVFRIGKIEWLNEIWHINLKFTNDHDEVLEKLTVHMSKIIQIHHPNPLVPFCRLLARMGEYGKAIKLCEKHCSAENGWEMKATLYDTLALKHADERDDRSALDLHQKALYIVAEHLDRNDPLLASYHNNVAIGCDVEGYYKPSIEHYQVAIDLELSAPQPDYTSIAYSYEGIGNILHHYFEKYEEAMNYYELAMGLMLAHLSSAHPDIISLYDDMADVYKKQNMLEKALDMLHKRLDTIQKDLESSSDDLVRTYKRIAEIYQMQNKFEEAFIMLNKCHELEAARPSSEDFNQENVNIDVLFAKILRARDNS